MGVIFDSSELIALERGGVDIARLWATLSRRGETVGAHDLIIAATALSLGFSVVTANRRDFGRIDGLRVEVR